MERETGEWRAGCPQALKLSLVLQHNTGGRLQNHHHHCAPGMRDRSSHPVQNNGKESQVSHVTMLTCHHAHM